MKKIAILGASSGLGKALAKEFHRHNYQLLISSRKEKELGAIAASLPGTEFIAGDFTNKEDQKKIFQKILEFTPDYIIYAAGAGTYGNFEDKKWSSQEWTFELNFLFPAKLLFDCLNEKTFLEIKNFIYVGSQVASQKPDPGAATYCASKHAMQGLITSMQKETRNPYFKVRIFNAPYMDTPMLPHKSWPRQVEGLVANPEAVSNQFYEWFNTDELNYAGS